MPRQRMVRKQVYIEHEHDAVLKHFARTWHVTEAEVLRHAIGLLEQSRPPEAVRKRAWEETKAFIAERRKLDVPHGPWKWNREDAYYGPRFDKWRDGTTDEPHPHRDDAIADR